MDKVTIAKLGSDNYAVRRVQMQSVLVSNSLWGAVAGGGVFNDEQTKAYMTLCVQPLHVRLISRARSAREAWTTLRDINQAQSTARQMPPKQQLKHLAVFSADLVTEYVGRAIDLRD